jgi:hypothetical protein
VIKSTDAVIDAIREIGLEVHKEKTKYILMSRHQNAWKIVNKIWVIDPLKMWQS